MNQPDKFSLLSNVPIAFKLWGVFFVFIIFFIATWFLTYNTAMEISGRLDSSKVELMKQADQLRRLMRDIEQMVNDSAQLKDNELLKIADGKAGDFREILKNLRKLDPTKRSDYIEIGKLFDVYYRNARSAALIIIRQDTFSKQMLAHAKKVSQSLPVLRARVKEVLDRSYSTFSSLLNQSTKSASRLATRNMFVIFILLVFSALSAPLIVRSITNPLAHLVSATKQIAGGNLDARAQVSGRDEVGALVLAFNEMAGKLKGKSVALEKITNELKTANAELREADRLKSEFLATMSHELRTPLNAIINFSEQVLEDWEHIAREGELAGSANEMLNRVLNSSRRLLALINELLDLAKIESGHMEIYLARFDMGAIVEEAVASVASLAKAKGLDIDCHVQDNLPLFMLDERKVLQILINLLSNAIKFTQEGGVTVRVERCVSPPGGLVKVIDTGIGISRKNRSIIFDRFRQAESADSRSYPGTGLGLNLVKEFTELMGGNVSVESEQGAGSVFTLCFPFEPPDDVMAQAKMGV